MIEFSEFASHLPDGWKVVFDVTPIDVFADSAGTRCVRRYADALEYLITPEPEFPADDFPWDDDGYGVYPRMEGFGEPV